ncbi:unnamed protein product [Schistosoma mattheei]|uniref:Uncharacterized protein n=1 Tax=Schistosoma mattheei TaxID=31246 RepID=A0A183PQB4_9TREM|nr:unnamed protein product [Schistosoma mattheei]
MSILPDQLQLLLDRQQQRFRKSQLNVLDNLRTRLLNVPCFGDVTEIDELISHLHTELENDCRAYEGANKSLNESLTSSNANEAVAHDPFSDPEMSISETCPVVGSNPTVHETCTDSEEFNSQGDPIVLPGNVSHASNNNQEPGTVLLDADYHNDPLSTSDAPHKFDNNISKYLNPDDFELNGVYPHYLVDFTEFPVQYVLNTIKLIVIWVYEDPTLFRGGG